MYIVYLRVGNRYSFICIEFPGAHKEFPIYLSTCIIHFFITQGIYATIPIFATYF